MSKFINIQLSEFGETITGKTPSSKNPEDYGHLFMFITPSDSFEDKMISKTERYLSEIGIDKLKSKVLPPKSILVTCIGSAMGKIAMNKTECITNQQINSIRIETSKFDSDYIYYVLKNNYKLLRNAATGSTAIPMLNKTDFDKLQINIHQDMFSQQKIAKVLSTLDAKIELNNRINKELEAMAKTLYDYWFVQFDFPHINGKPYKSSGGKMIYNEELKREIPEDWEVDSLWNIANFFNGLAMQKHRPTNENYLRVIKIREMNEGFSDGTEFASADVPKEAIIENGDILFSWSATLDVKMWSNGKGALNQHIFKVTSDKYPKVFYFFELLNYLQHFKMMANLRKTTMGHITQEHLKQSKIVIPPMTLIENIDKKINPIFEKKLLLEQETQHLTQLRDFLLPMLMNGQVSVK